MQQLAEPSNTLSGGRLVKAEEAEGHMRPWPKLPPSDSLSGDPIGNWVAQKGETRVRGRGRIPRS